jgi:molybdopterin-binding protein
LGAEPAREPQTTKEHAMKKYGARNEIIGTVKSVKNGDIMSLVKFDVTDPCEMASVLTTESVEQLALKPGDRVKLLVKAVHVLPVKE